MLSVTTKRSEDFSAYGGGANYVPSLEKGRVWLQGKVKIVMKGEGGQWGAGVYVHRYAAAGGILEATKFFSDMTELVVKVAAGAYNPPGGNGVLLYENDTLVLGAGGGGGPLGGGGGIIGGTATNRPGYSYAYYQGFGANGSPGGYTTYSSTSTLSAQGGAWVAQESGGVYRGYGGSGSSAADCNAAGYSCPVITQGGNSPEWSGGYSAATYGGNRASGLVTITYCGPSASSTCP